MKFDIDKALLVARTLRTTEIATPTWVNKYPLWFMALRTEDIIDIHNIIWSKRRTQTFARYAEQLANLECTLFTPDILHSSSSVEKIIVANDEARLKFYQYLIAILFVPGLRTIDTAVHGYHVWGHKYFCGEKFDTLFKSIDVNELKRIVLSAPVGIVNEIFISFKKIPSKLMYSNIASLTTSNVKKIINNTVIASCKAGNPMKYVYGYGWKKQDRFKSLYHYKQK